VTWWAARGCCKPRRAACSVGTGAAHPPARPLAGVAAAAQAVEGVEAASVVKFQRMATPDAGAIENGVIPIGRLEIARLNNDPNFREHGVFSLNLGGGK